MPAPFIKSQTDPIVEVHSKGCDGFGKPPKINKGRIFRMFWVSKVVCVENKEMIYDD